MSGIDCAWAWTSGCKDWTKAFSFFLFFSLLLGYRLCVPPSIPRRSAFLSTNQHLGFCLCTKHVSLLRRTGSVLSLVCIVMHTSHRRLPFLFS